jgi:heme exporter protein A
MRMIGASVAIERGGRRLFSDLSFEAAAGQLLVVTGPNGAGKSSLLRAIAGLLSIADGAVTLEGGVDQQSIGEQAHYLGHANALKGALSAGENLKFWAAMLGPWEAGAARRPMPVDEALERVGLAHAIDFPVSILSAGQKRRVALARLLVAYRPVWLLDEPTAALDAAAEARLVEIMRAHLADGGLIVTATHARFGLEAHELKLGATGEGAS